MRKTIRMNKTQSRILKIQNMAKNMKQSMEEFELTRQESIRREEEHETTEEEKNIL